MKHQKLRCFILILAVLSIIISVSAAKISQSPEQNLVKIQDQLLQQERAGITNPDLYNQIGLSYYKQGQAGKAVVYFLRALRLNSNHKEARNNLEYASGHVLDKEMYTQSSYLSSVFQKAYNFFNLNALVVIVLVLLLIVVLCLHWLLHLPLGQDKAVPVMWLLIFGFVFLLASTLLGLKYRGYNNRSQAVIIEQETGGYSGPGIEFAKAFTLHSGLIVNITRSDKDWALISLPNGGAGWVHLTALDRVRP
jgi:hypothetical protein